MKRITLIRGAPGSGKSTLADKLSREWIVAEVDYSGHEADRYMNDGAGRYKFDPSRLAECHQLCQQHTCYSMMCGRDEIVVSNTFTKLWELEPYLVLARMWGYEIRVVHMMQQHRNVHGVPDDVVARMRAQYEPYEGELKWL